MGGGLMQLVAYGAQDIYLTGNPQITFFKVVYRRHTNFSIECIKQDFVGRIGTRESEVTSTIGRNGDLIIGMHLEISLTGGVESGATTYINWTNNTGHAYIKSCEIEIGGTVIDRQTGHWLDIWNELSDHHNNEYLMLNKHEAKNAYLKSGSNTKLNDLKCYVPLKFWFCRSRGLAIPLISLQYQEVKLNFAFRDIKGLINCDGTSNVSVTTPPSVDLWADYVYLGTDERRRFSQSAHEYLIEQVQHTSEAFKSKIRLRFNHPVKEIIWVAHSSQSVKEDITRTNIDATLNKQGINGLYKNNDYFNYMSSNNSDVFFEYIGGQKSQEHFTEMHITLNGQRRFDPKNASYFRTIQPASVGHKVPSKHIYLYSFCLNPEEHQPSGTCNFSRIDTSHLVFGSANTTGAEKLEVFAVNYNILRIMGGMGGLAYSN